MQIRPSRQGFTCDCSHLIRPALSSIATTMRERYFQRLDRSGYVITSLGLQ